MDAGNKLIEHNLRLVAHIIKKYYTQTGDQDDLISIGTIGLIKGVIQMRSGMRGNQVKSRKKYGKICIKHMQWGPIRHQYTTEKEGKLSISR